MFRFINRSPSIFRTSFVTAYASRDGVPPGPHWLRSRGHPRTTWVHQACSDINTSALDAQDINMAIGELSQRTQSYAINDDDDVINLS